MKKREIKVFFILTAPSRWKCFCQKFERRKNFFHFYLFIQSTMMVLKKNHNLFWIKLSHSGVCACLCHNFSSSIAVCLFRPAMYCTLTPPTLPRFHEDISFLIPHEKIYFLERNVFDKSEADKDRTLQLFTTF